MATISSKIKPDSTYSIKDNTFFAVPKENPKDLIQKEIGDFKVPTEFLPQTKIMRWDNEVNFSVRLVHDEASPIISKVGETVKWSGKKVEALFYDINSKEHPEGASEFEVVLKEKPLTNVVEFTLNTKGLDFFYQPELTQEEKDNGSSQPENVIGSYAVYASENKINYVGGKEYKTGKVGHIYRPQIEDSAGNKVWGELNVDIEKGILSVTIPQEFLDKAVYPVRHAAGLTFGYTSAGSTFGAYKDDIHWFQYQISDGGGTLNSISEYCSKFSTYTGNIKEAIYDDSSNNPYNLVDYTGETTGGTSTASWKTLNVTSGATINNAYYWLCSWSSDYVTVYWDRVIGQLRRYKAVTYGSFPNPVTGTIVANNHKRSIYATYEESGPVEKNIAETGQGEESISCGDISITNNRYWVGGSGNWSDTVHWAETSGGAGGASVPTSDDDVFIDANSGFGSGGTITIGVDVVTKDFISSTGHSYSVDDEENEYSINIYGSLELESGLSFTGYSYIILSAETSKTIKTNGCSVCGVQSYGAGSYQLLDDYSGSGITFENGSFDANDFNISLIEFHFIEDAVNLTMGTGTWETRTFIVRTGTIDAETSTLKLSGTGTGNLIVYDGAELYNVEFYDKNGNYTTTNGSFSCNILTIRSGAKVLFREDKTVTVVEFIANGTSERPITINSSGSIPLSQHTLSCSSGTVECDYLDISNSNVTGGANWYAGSNSVNGGNNTGWIWGDAIFQIEVSDIGEAVDILNILNQLSISDIGSVNELVNILGLIGKTDNATATESINILNSLNVSETATGSDVIDLLLLLKELTLSEIGLGSEELSIIGSSSIELTENASGQDILYILNYISAHEIGSGIEDLDILEELNISDSAIGNEFLETLSENGVFDNASAIDIIAKYLVKIYTKRNNPYGGKTSPYNKKTNPFSIKN